MAVTPGPPVLSCHAEERTERMSGAGRRWRGRWRGRAAASLTYSAAPAAASPIQCPLDRSHDRGEEKKKCEAVDQRMITQVSFVPSLVLCIYRTEIH